MNLVSLLILPAVINLQDNDAARFTIAGLATVVLVIAVAFSKRKSEGMGAPEDMSTAESRAAAGLEAEEGVHDGEPAASLALKALDRWIVDLGDEDADLRTQLRSAKARLKEPSS
jgi:hypothetical protein